MGNEMGNNNTSAIKEEDNISESDKKNLLEDDPSEHANVTSQDVRADYVKEENQNIVTSLAKDVMENSSKDFNDISQEDDHADDVKEEIQTIPTEETKYAKEEARILDSSNITSMLENDSMEADTHPSDKHMENQVHSTTEAEGFQEKATGITSEVTTTELGEVSPQEESLADDVKEEIQVIPIAEAIDIEEKATESMIENDSLERDTHESDVNMKNQVLPIAEAEDIEEESKGIASDHTISSLESELLIGKDDQEQTAKLSYDDETSELEGQTQEDKQDGDIFLPITKGKTTILASDDPLNLRNSFDGEGEEINGIRQSEKSSYAGSFESESCESLSSSSMESTEECRKQEDSTDNHDPNDESSIKHDEEETIVLTLNAVTQSNGSEELQEPPSVVKSLCSLQATESLQTDTFLDANCNIQQINDGVLEKDTESKEKVLCANKSDGRYRNEFEKGLIDTSEATSDPSTTNNNNNSNENLLTNVNYTTEDSLNPFPETFALDSQLKSDQEDISKVLKESEKENPKDYNKTDQCMKEIKEKNSDMVNNTYDMTIGSSGDYNVERHTTLDSSVFEISNSDRVEEPKGTENGLQHDASVFEIAKSDQVEEPKVIENGLQLDAYVNNSNKASDESSAGPEQKYSVVPEAETVSLIADTNENPESSYAMVNDFEETDMSDHSNSILETINQEEYFSLQNSTSLKQTNESKYFDLTVEKHDFSKLTVPSIDLLDEEETEKESEKHSQQAEATSAATTICTEPCSNNSILANVGYETRLSIESNSDNPVMCCQIQKSPSFNLDLRIEARKEESGHTPLLYQEKSNNESLSKQTDVNISNFMLHNAEMPVEEKIVTMERSYSEISNAPFTSISKDEEEAHLLVMAHTPDNHAGTNKEVKEVSSRRTPEGKEKRKSRSYFFSSCVCCATVTN